MLVEFLDRPGRPQHAKFQRWRRGHDGAYFLAFKTKTAANLHLNGGCHHLGDAEWGAAGRGHSLTSMRKVCADHMGELTRWAANNGVEWTWCAHCERSGARSDVAAGRRAPAPAPRVPAPKADLARLRRTSGDAADKFEELCGATGVDACAELLADAIERAVQAGGAWAVTLDPKDVRLNVGPVRLLNISKAGVWFAATDEVGSPPSWVTEHASRKGGVEYASVPVPSRSFSARASRVGKLPASLRDAFLSYVEAAAGSRRGGASLYVRAHSPGVVSFLNERLSRDLPQPTGAELAEPEVVPTEDLSTTEDFVEGGRRTFVLSVRERSGRAREACIRAKGTRCAACGMSFEEVYGERGAGFIEVHHLNPMAEADGERTVDEAVDLVPVCPNCHRMLHRGERLLTPAELAAHIAETRSSRS